MLFLEPALNIARLWPKTESLNTWKSVPKSATRTVLEEAALGQFAAMAKKVLSEPRLPVPLISIKCELVPGHAISRCTAPQKSIDPLQEIRH